MLLPYHNLDPGLAIDSLCFAAAANSAPAGLRAMQSRFWACFSRRMRATRRCLQSCVLGCGGGDPFRPRIHTCPIS